MKWFLLDCLFLLTIAISAGCNQAAFDRIDLDPSLFTTPAAAAEASSGGVPGPLSAKQPVSPLPAAPPASAVRPWLTDYSEAWRIAAEQRRPLLIVLHRQSCAPCKELLYSTFRDARIRERLAERYVVAVLDIDQTERRIIEGLSQGRLVLPATLVVDHGRIIARRSGYLVPSAFGAWLDSTEPTARIQTVPAALSILRPPFGTLKAAGCAGGCTACGTARASGDADAAATTSPKRPIRRLLRALPIVRRRCASCG